LPSDVPFPSPFFFSLPRPRPPSATIYSWPPVLPTSLSKLDAQGRSVAPTVYTFVPPGGRRSSLSFQVGLPIVLSFNPMSPLKKTQLFDAKKKVRGLISSPVYAYDTCENLTKGLIVFSPVLDQLLRTLDPPPFISPSSCRTCTPFSGLLFWRHRLALFLLGFYAFYADRAAPGLHSTPDPPLPVVLDWFPRLAPSILFTSNFLPPRWLVGVPPYRNYWFPAKLFLRGALFRPRRSFSSSQFHLSARGAVRPSFVTGLGCALSCRG